MASIIILSEGLDPQMGGPSNSIPNFADSLTKRNIPVIIYCPAKKYKMSHGIETVKIITYKNFFDFIKKLAKQLLNKQKERKYVHLNYIWRLEAFLVLFFSKTHCFTLIFNARGMLMKKAISSGRKIKSPIFYILLKPLLRFSDSVFQASSNIELEELKTFFPTKKIFLNVLGYERNSIDYKRKDATEKFYNKELVIISRIDKYKRIDQIIRNFIEVGAYNQGWKLSIYGAEKLSNYEELIDPHKIDNISTYNIKLGLFINEKEKIEILNKSTFFISASNTESFGLTIAESLDSSTPVIIRNNTLWEDYIVMGCGYSFNDSELKNILESLKSLSFKDYDNMIEKIESSFQPISWEEHTSTFLENISYQK